MCACFLWYTSLHRIASVFPQKQYFSLLSILSRLCQANFSLLIILLGTDLSPCPGFVLSPSFLCRSMTPASRGHRGQRPRWPDLSLASLMSLAPGLWLVSGLNTGLWLVTRHSLDISDLTDITLEDKSRSSSYFRLASSPRSILQMRKPFNLINQLCAVWVSSSRQYLDAGDSDNELTIFLFFIPAAEKADQKFLLN